MKTRLTTLLYGTLVIGIFSGLLLIPAKEITVAKAYATQTPTPTPTPPHKALFKASKYKTLDQWITALEIKESQRDATLKILDRNGKYSYSCLQFQFETLRSYSRAYGIRDDFGEEDMFNCQLQKQVAKKMITERYENWRHWYTSTLAIGFPPKV